MTSGTGIQPRCGEIWFARLPTDPPDKGPRPVVVVSPDHRNQNVRATTILVVPFSTTLTEGVAAHVRLNPGETGLRETCEAQPENIAVLRKEHLQAPRSPLRRLGRHRILEIARGVIFALDFLPEDLLELR